jgi:hypothetical protein
VIESEAEIRLLCCAAMPDKIRTPIVALLLLLAAVRTWCHCEFSMRPDCFVAALLAMTQGNWRTRQDDARELAHPTG